MKTRRTTQLGMFAQQWVNGYHRKKRGSSSKRRTKKVGGYSRSWPPKKRGK